ncbi:MAG: hypothetical protein MUE68_09055 [Bacteroidetes bacterium]|jgi:hypothetical protein|nr:hypothetical protein [Bacteroidota bacterium]
MKCFHLCVTIVMILLLAVESIAQDQRPMRGPAGQRVEQLKKLRMQEALALDEETSIRFFARYNEHQDELRAVGKSRGDLIDDLQSLLKKNAPEAEIDAKLRDVLKAEKQVIDLRLKFADKLGEILTRSQVARYVVFERNFNQDLRELMRESAQDRWRGRN